MDTRAPPIASRTQDRCVQQQQQAKLKQQHQHQQQSEEVTLPPLASSAAQRQRGKLGSAAAWRNGTGQPPGILAKQELQKRRPYKVLGIGATPLMHACQQADRARVLKLLREQESTIGYRDRAHRSALHYCMDAATGGAVAQAAPELLDSPDAEGHTALHLAVIAGDHQLVAVLLANGADVNAKDLEGHSVLHWATVCGEVECARLVLAAGARPSSPDLRGGSPLHYAAQCCGAAATAELAVPKKVGLKVLQTLLEFGAEVNARDEDGRQPILWAASAGSVEAVLALVRAGGSAVSGASDKDGLTALHCAASRGHARCIEALVTLCDAQPDHVDDNGCSALHYAATLGHADATSLLLKLGADPNRQDRKGRTPALCAAAKGQLETLKILAQHGGSLHARTIRGTGVAHEAVSSGRLELVKWLARRRPGLLDVATPDGKTPLHVAALHGHLDACKLLLDNGARINALLRTSKGGLMTALDAALYRGHRDCAKLIQLHGGTTAQHLRSQKPGPTKVFSTKLRLKQLESSSDSELNEGSPREQRHHRQHRHRGEPELYYEERWVERRTRRRANRRRLSRQDSRSFSEEELRHSKASTTARPNERQQRRALSENARYDEAATAACDANEDFEETGSRRRRSERQSRRQQKEDEAGKSASGSASEELSPSAASDEESSSVSDDSLEVVVVKRSLEKTSEKIVSGRRSRTPRDAKDSSRSDSKKASKEQGKTKDERPDKKGKPDAPKRKSSQEQKPFDGDSTSQDTVEQVTITADVHKNAAPDSSRDKGPPAEKEQPAPEHEPDEQVRSKMDDILEKADELQNALLSKAADLKKDMEEMRHQMSQKAETEGKDDKEEEKKEDTKKEDTKKEDPKKEEKSAGEGKKDQAAEEGKGDAGSKPGSTLDSLESTSHELSSARDGTPRDGKSVIERKKSEDKGPAEVSEKAEKKEQSPKTGDKTEEGDKAREKADGATSGKDEKSKPDAAKRESISHEVSESKRGSVPKEDQSTSKKQDVQVTEQEKTTAPKKDDKEAAEAQGQPSKAQAEAQIPGTESFRFADESSSSSPGPGQGSSARRSSRPSTGKRRGKGATTTGSSMFESSEERSPDRSAIVAVIESPEWDEEDDEELDKEIRQAVGEPDQHDDEDEEDEEGSDGLAGDDDDVGIVRVLPSTSEEEAHARTSNADSLPQLQTKSGSRLVRLSSPTCQHHLDPMGRIRRDSGGRDSGIEPSPRVSRIPRRTDKCCPNSERQRGLHMETVTRDVQISLRRYHLERKIFFQLMELKRLQIRQGRANEQVLVKRLVEAFNKSGMSGPVLGVAKYDRPYTFRHFEMFLYEQLRKLQRRPATPDWCTEAKQCTQKTHRCHHATSAYTSVPIYTYLGGGGPERPSLLPRIESRGRGQMTVEVTHGDEKQVIALPSEKIDHTKRYYVTFTVRGETTDSDKPRTPSGSSNQRNTKSV